MSSVVSLGAVHHSHGKTGITKARKSESRKSGAVSLRIDMRNHEIAKSKNEKTRQPRSRLPGDADPATYRNARLRFKIASVSRS
jgi:hypothetical protein